jgi:hypothetical protein
MQKPYTEKPAKVLAEQYHAASTPPALGVCVQADALPFVPGGIPHVHTELGPKVLHETDMIVGHRSKPGVFLDVLPLADFEEIYGNVPG